MSHTVCSRRVGTEWLIAAAILVLVLVGSGVAGAADPKVVAFSLSGEAQATGLEPVDYSSGKWHIAEVQGRMGVQLEMQNLYLQVLDEYLTGGPYNVVIALDYLSQAEGSFRLEYDSLATNQAYEKGPWEVVDAAKVGMWNHVEWTFEGVQFANRQNGKSDMRIRLQDKVMPLIIGAMSITATP